MYQSRTTISDFCFDCRDGSNFGSYADGGADDHADFCGDFSGNYSGVKKRSTCDADLFVDRRGRCSGIFKFYRWNSKLCGTNRRISRVLSDYGIFDRAWRGTKK